MLEICADSIESALAAVEGGASRIELCSALSEGGLTPSIGTLIALKKGLNVQVPIFCMLRPRQGNDFLYSDLEMKSILYDLELLSLHGADGFVFGALDCIGKVNLEQCKDVLKKAGILPVTFHRAFDLTAKKEMHQTCQIIQSLGFKRILTSGFEQKVELGLEIVKELVDLHPRITIIPGSGITPKNLSKILQETSCKEFHASAKKEKYSTGHESKIDFSNGQVFVTDVGIVRELVNILEVKTHSENLQRESK